MSPGRPATPGTRAEDFEAGGFLPASFLDWPGRVAAVLFARGCNLRCPWCHNPDLVLRRAEPYPLGAILAALRERRPFLDGLVVSGGEPAIQPALFPLLRRIREELDLPVCLNTNGTRPDVVRACLEEGLILRVAMDVKAPPRLYPRICGLEGAGGAERDGAGAPAGADGTPGASGGEEAPDRIAARVLETLALLRERGADYELRTTRAPELMAEEGALEELRALLGDDPRWRLQEFDGRRPLLRAARRGEGTDGATRREEGAPDLRLGVSGAGFRREEGEW